MASVIAALRSNKPPVFEDNNEEESLFDTLISKLPPKDTWENEYILGVLVLGWLCISLAFFSLFELNWYSGDIW
jgi:hypothetical protein